MRLAVGMTPCTASAPAPARPRTTFAVSSIHQRRNSLLLLKGELDVATVGDLVALLRLCMDLGQDRIVLDFRELTFIGAVGLAVLVEADRRLQNQGGELVVRNPSPFTAKLLAITGLAERCEGGDQHSPASRSFAGPAGSAS
jgi:anti-sigma B factor antagonist